MCGRVGVLQSDPQIYLHMIILSVVVRSDSSNPDTSSLDGIHFTINLLTDQVALDKGSIGFSGSVMVKPGH